MGRELRCKPRKEELSKCLWQVSVRADTMLDRLTLEENMCAMLCKLPSLILCVILFLVALFEFSPPRAIGDVHRRVERHFSLSDVSSVASEHTLYGFIETFQQRNKELQATSDKYWCEARYTSYVWNDDLKVPVWKCLSQRQYALSLTKDPAASWSAARRRRTTTSPTTDANALSGDTASEAAGDNASDSAGNATDNTTGNVSRRLSSEDEVLHQTATQEVPPCVDDDQMLQLMLKNVSATCADSANSVCDYGLGFHHCTKTCGYCSPFTYQPISRYQQAQVTMLPAVVYQTRFHTKDCHGFAGSYDGQSYNPVLSTLPAMDGLRNGTLLTCVDRSRRWEEEYAVSLLCPKEAPSHHCNGRLLMSRKVDFAGAAIYPEFLIGSQDVPALKAIQWFARQTETLTLSSLIYTEGVDIYTSLAVTFQLDAAGNIDGQYNMISYRDLGDGHKEKFIVCLVFCALISLVSLGCGYYSIWQMRNSPGKIRLGYQTYEFFSKCVFILYPLILLIVWSQQSPMALEYHKLVDAFLGATSSNEDDMTFATDGYFRVKDHITSETNFVKGHQVTSYIICYVQVVQLILYFSVHPKISLLTDTVARSMSQMLHFFIVAGTVYLWFCCIGHWMFGETLPTFLTFGSSCTGLLRMLFGEFLAAPGVENLDSLMLCMYWLYLLTFMFVAWLTLLNVFLAIVVDAFQKTNEESFADRCVGNFFTDCMKVVTVHLKYKSKAWPARSELIGFFEDVVKRAEAARDPAKAPDMPAWLKDLECHAPDIAENTESCSSKGNQPMCTTDELAQKFPSFNEQALAALLCYYHAITSSVLCRRSAKVSPPVFVESAQSRWLRSLAMADPGDPPEGPPSLEPTRSGTLTTEAGATGKSATQVEFENQFAALASTLRDTEEGSASH